MADYKNYEVEDFIYDDFFINWVLKNSPEDAAFWQQWIAENPAREKTVERARVIILSIGVKPLHEEFTDAEINNMVAGLQQQITSLNQPVILKPRFYQTNWFRAAATVVLVATAGLIFFRSGYRGSQISTSNTTVQADPFLRVSNNTHESKLIRMADGSLAVLKPGSDLRYLRSFHDKREVYLEGEAFFEVHKNPRIPFLVHSHDMVIRVLGTSFTVKNLHNNRDVKVVVNTGRVLVYNQKNANEPNGHQYQVILTSNQQVIYTGKQASFKKEILTVPLALSKEVAKKAFTFDNAPLSAVIDRINKDYDVNIEYDKAKLGNISLTISISDRPLDEKVKLICKAINASCEFVDGRIIITEQNPNHILTN